MLKQTIVKILDACGLEIRRKTNRSLSAAQDKTKDNILDRMRVRTDLADMVQNIEEIGLSPQTVIDIGVAGGTSWLYGGFKQAKLLLVEPMAEHEERLQQLVKERGGYYAIAAASSKAGEHTLYFNQSHISGASLLPPSGVTLCERVIPVVTVDGLCKEHDLRGPYVIKVDTQGSELEILEGAQTVLKDTELVVLEVSLFAFRPNWPTFYEVIDYMKRHGFVVYDLMEGHNRPLDGARAQIDVAFAKKDGFLRKTNRWATREQAELHVQLTLSPSQQGNV